MKTASLTVSRASDTCRLFTDVFAVGVHRFHRSEVLLGVCSCFEGRKTLRETERGRRHGWQSTVPYGPYGTYETLTGIDSINEGRRAIWAASRITSRRDGGD